MTPWVNGALAQTRVTLEIPALVLLQYIFPGLTGQILSTSVALLTIGRAFRLR